MSKIIDRTGQQYGRLTVLNRGKLDSKDTYWLCKCSCGSEKEYSSRSLRDGTKSCGCQTKEITRSRSIKHGLYKSSTYHSWSGMKSRCNNPNNQDYAIYGGRGIKLEPSWLSFEKFLEDMGTCPVGYSIDRIDNNGDYTPSNCRWVNAKTQANNRNSNILITYNGVTHNIESWAKLLDINYHTLYNRLTTMKWSIERTLTEVPGPQGGGVMPYGGSRN
jgi:hypothetical protein